MTALFLFVMQSAWGQGSTSSRITGQITDGNETLIGANVIAVHEPTGFKYGTATNVEGLFTLNNVNVGGPYTITVSYTGFEEYILKDIYLNLGQTESFNIKMNEAALQLEEIVVTAGGLFDGNRTGSETKVSEEDIAALPTTDRGLNDYLRLTPQADIGNSGATNGGGISFSGVNNRFNAIFIDGAVNNDVFGLANSGTNGGQAGISPISPDALEQIQVDVEIQRDELPRPFIQSEYNGDSDANQLNAIRQKLIDDFGYDPGGFENNPQTVDGEKVLVKLDYNINKKHKLSARHSYVKGTTEIHPAPSANRVVFSNVGYIFPSTTNSTAVELKSIFSPNTSNNLILGYTKVSDDRDILGDPFPQFELPDGNGRVTIGTDNFSFSNIVNQDVFTITNNFNLYKGKHSFTFGTHNEFFKIENLFTIFSTPEYSYFFDGVNRFLNDENPDLVLFGHEQAFGNDEIRLGDAAENLGPSFNAMQLAFYGQDEIQINKDFKLTVGLRFDVPIFTDDPPLNNTAFNTTTIPLLEAAGYDLRGARASQAPSTQLLISPRIGFNYDVNGDKTTQLRGGVGVFTSRVPWVWPGGMFIRNGLNSAFNVGFGQPIYTTPEEWVENLTIDDSPTGDVDLFVEDFKYPQILRASLAMDKKLPWGINGTAEITFTKTLNNMDVKSINFFPSTENLTGADDRPVINFNERVDDTYSNITLVDNTNQGYTFNITGQASKQFNRNTSLNVAYSFTRAEALVDGRGFINNTNWGNILSVQGNNNPDVTRSSFDAGSRLTAFLTHRFDYSDFLNTSVSLFFTAKSGSPYSFVYNSEATSDLSQSAGNEDLIFVPANQGDINLVMIT